MRIDANEFAKAIGKVAMIAGLDKKQPGVMMYIADSSVELYYSSLQKAISIRVPAAPDEEEIGKRVVFDYKQLEDNMKNWVDSGRLSVEDLEMKFVKASGLGDKEIAVVKVTKYVNIINGDEVVKRKASNFDCKLQVASVEQLSVSQRVLAVPICEDMFPSNGADTMNIKELKEIVAVASGNDAKTLYFSANRNGLFASSTNSSVVIKADSEITKTYVLNSNMAKAMVSVFDSVKDADELLMNTIEVDGTTKACLFFLEDESLSVYLAVAATVNANIQSVKRFTSYPYTYFHLDIMTEPMKDMVKAASILNGGAKGKIGVYYDEVEGTYKIKCTAENSGKSISNEYSVDCSLKTTLSGVELNPKDTVGFTVDLNQFLSIINMCKTDNMCIDIARLNDENLALRIGFLEMETARAALQEFKAEHEEGYKLTVEDKMNLRDKYLVTSFYTVVNQK